MYTNKPWAFVLFVSLRSCLVTTVIAEATSARSVLMREPAKVSLARYPPVAAVDSITKGFITTVFSASVLPGCDAGATDAGTAVDVVVVSVWVGAAWPNNFCPTVQANTAAVQ